ncbi:hypothetical protein BOQ62_11805, partial [Chryseobacterium sp. CH21]
TSLVSATSIIGPPIMTHLFYYFTHDKAPFKFSGAPFSSGFGFDDDKCYYHLLYIEERVW